MRIAGKAFDYAVKGKDVSQMRQTMGEQKAVEDAAAAKQARRNAQKRISKQKAPVRKVLRQLGWIQK